VARRKSKMDLGNIEDYKKLDSMGVFDALSLFPEQIKTTWEQATSSSIPEISCHSVVVTGMGGSSNAAKIIQGLFESDLKIPFIVHNDYGLPAWVNSETLVVANSYSGNTEETLSGIDTAIKVGAKILGIATGGKIGNMIKSGEIEGVVITPGASNPPNFPKSGLGVSLGGLLGALVKAGVLKVSEDELFESLNELVDIRDSWDAIEMSKWFKGSLPVLFGGRPFIGSLNAGRNAMCEISRNFTQFYDFPEMNHVLIEATLAPSVAKDIHYLFFESDYSHERVKLRFEVTKKVFDEQGLMYHSYQLKGKTKLTQALELPHYCAWLGFYISMLDSVDPGPEPWILKLKSDLSQPVH
jgi:glucose/mannose-6-phosphate isomerase